MHLTAADIRRLFPRAREDYVRMLTTNGRLLAQHGLSEPLPLCHFLSQIGAETGEMTVLSESGNYSAERLRAIFPKYFTPAQAKVYARRPEAILSRAYANRMGNGSEASGDGWRYRGRGPLQNTGKDSYRRLGQRLGADLVANPDLLATDLTLALKVALLYWSDLKLSEVAQRGATHETVLAVSRGINLGNPRSGAQPNGLKERKAAFERAWKLFGGNAPAKLDPSADGILEDGEEGEAVSDLQSALLALGYPVGEADGVFGERTVAAVAAFQAREALGGDLGKWQIAWADRLATAKPFENAARQEITARDLAAKGDQAVSLLGWLRGIGVAVAGFFGLDAAADQPGIQWPETFSALRQAVEPVTGHLQWALGSRWVLGMLLGVGVWALGGWLTGVLVQRYRDFGVKA